MESECDTNDLDDLVGQELTSITVATNNIRLSFVKYPFSVESGFESEASIDIQAGFKVRTNTESYEADSDNIAQLRQQGGRLVGLIERAIVEVDQLPGGELFLCFDDGARLEISVNKEGFESFQLHVRRAQQGVVSSA